jgi:PadR family transcriptional regulator PadR
MEPQAISSDLIRGHIDTIILYSLTDSDKHAQQISDYVAEKSNDEYQINEATLYSSLKRLESLKYVSAYWHSAETGRRRYFKISDAGREIIRQNTESWSYSRNIIGIRYSLNRRLD